MQYQVLAVKAALQYIFVIYTECAQWCSGTHTIPYGVWATLFAATCRPYDPIL